MTEDKGLKPLYIQAADKISQEIRRCNFREGERIPRINQLSRMLKVNTSAMERGLIYLEEQQILRRDTSSAFRVAKGAVSMLAQEEKRNFLEIRLPKFLREAEDLGINREMIIQYINKEVPDESHNLS